tara:strand:+ start:1882 stop:4470 length:2589 start_codon:yes stop_codon:yes gene_type:complete
MQKAIYSFIIFFLLQGIIFSQSSVTERKLHNNWSFKQKGSENWFPATVPGCVHLDLMKNKIIKDPYFQLNESKVQWIDKKDWIYQKEFFLNEAINYQNHEIIFEGLDTYASVYLNDNLILKSNNMHRTHIADVKPFLKTGKNTLRVVLESPIKKGLELYNALGYTIPVSANDQAEKGQVEGGKRVNVFTRKAAYHYGWDWGPRLVTSGIWRPITLRSWNKCKIKDFNIKYSLDSSAMVSTNLLIESTVDQEPANITITLNDSIVVNKDFKLLTGEQNIISHFSIDHPILWWPNGIGEQYLYDIKAQVTLKDNRVFANQKQGIRTIVLEVQDSTKSPNFFFKVNGYPVFSKGVNYIPQDIFLPRVSTKDYQKLLSAAANANMNMIRVWGGGIYEDDRFYELCDSLGLMVWQDFMFACAMYPGDSSFLENVRLEAIDNYNRIKKHTSIALWCGNNENLAAWKRWGWEATAIKEQSAQIADKIWHNYDTLFHHILPKVVRDYHPEHGHSKNTNATNYWASSPSASPGIPESYKTGDTHYWGVWWGKEPFENFNSKISPFMSEYGFQSFPEYASFMRFATLSDTNMYSEVMKSHQRSSIGNATIEEYMAREFKTPKNFESLLYVSQLLQADGIRTAIEAHRRNKATCMGSLYWQLNDCWPGASWSSIDYYGKWKALHYNVQNAFKPIIISHEFIDSNLKIYLISDLKESFSGEIQITYFPFKGDSCLKKWTKKVYLNPFEAKSYLTILKNKIPENSYLEIALKKGENYISTKNVYLSPFKELDIPKPELKFYTKIDEKENTILITVKSKFFAKGVCITSNSENNFSDNFFDLAIAGEKRISLKIKDEEDIYKVIKSLKIKSLWDTL